MPENDETGEDQLRRLIGAVPEASIDDVCADAAELIANYAVRGFKARRAARESRAVDLLARGVEDQAEAAAGHPGGSNDMHRERQWIDLLDRRNKWRALAAELAGLPLTEKRLGESDETLIRTVRLAERDKVRKIQRKIYENAGGKAEVWLVRSSSVFGYIAMGPMGKRCWLESVGQRNNAGGFAITMDDQQRTLETPAGLEQRLRDLYISDPHGAYAAQWLCDCPKNPDIIEGEGPGKA